VRVDKIFIRVGPPLKSFLFNLLFITDKKTSSFFLFYCTFMYYYISLSIIKTIFFLRALVQKRRKGYSLFSAAFALSTFLKNAVAFFKLFWFTNAAICIVALVNQRVLIYECGYLYSRTCKSKRLIYECGYLYSRTCKSKRFDLQMRFYL